MTERVPIERVYGVDEVTVWMWPNSRDPLTVRFTYHEWAKVERKAEKVADGDIEQVVGHLIQKEVVESYA